MVVSKFSTNVYIEESLKLSHESVIEPVVEIDGGGGGGNTPGGGGGGGKSLAKKRDPLCQLKSQ